MAFKKVSAKTSVVIESPESLFRDLRNRKVEGLLAQQADILRKYMENIGTRDIALELPTGSGKTLVGLLIAEWKRKAQQQRCLMLCPTRQLVHQVVEQASEKYGLKAINFAGSKHNFTAEDKSSFINCEAIGIATYNAFFNTHTFFENVDTIVFDDAHSAENYVANFWSMEIKRSNEDIFNKIWSVIEEYLPDNDRINCNDSDEDYFDNSFVNMLPGPYFLMCINDINAIMKDYVQSNENYRYRWEMIRNNLHACNLYYSFNSILIRPFIPPTKSFLPFQNCHQRIYMSATLGEGGDLERIFGVKSIKRIPAPKGWDKQGIGRRFFIFPMRKKDEKQSLNLAISWIAKFNRALILTPSEKIATDVRRIVHTNEATKDFILFDAKHLEESKGGFIRSKDAIAILANRYDGIDLIGEECRYLIIYGYPQATNLQERFIITRLGSNIIFNVRLQTRLIQAIGRCTRSSSDYALVVIIGEKIHNYFHNPDHRISLHPELHAEVIYGIAQSDIDEKDLNENIDFFIEHAKIWKDAEDNIIELRDTKNQRAIPYTKELAESVKYEVQYQDALWVGDYENALRFAKNVLVKISGGNELKGYAALWNYFAGIAAYQMNQQDSAKKHFTDAFLCVSAVPWFKQIKEYISDKLSVNSEDIDLSERIERIEYVLERFGKSSSRKINQHLTSIRSGLLSNKATLFEDAQENLGRLLGFEANNSKEDGAPDPWWISEDNGIVFEDYTATGSNPVISKKKTLQAKGHPDYLKTRYPKVKFQVVFCTTSNTIEPSAIPYCENIYYITRDDFYKWAKNALEQINYLWDIFTAIGNISWREKAKQRLIENKFSTKDVISFLTQKKLSSLE